MNTISGATVAAADLVEYTHAIEEKGYVHIPQVFSQDVVADALDRIRHWFDQMQNGLSDRMPRLNKDQAMVYNLQNKDVFFVRMLLENGIMEGILKHFLNDRWFSSIPKDEPNYILRSFLARSSKHRMPMHIDSFVPYTGSHSFIMQCVILLEDMHEDNGCTVIVPGSHKSDEYASQDAFEHAVSIHGKAGDLVIWDSRTWHAAKENVSQGTRWSMIATFCRWWIKQAFDIPGNLPQDIYDQLTDNQKAILGYSSVPYDDETYGIDMKRSYEFLPEKVADYRF